MGNESRSRCEIHQKARKVTGVVAGDGQGSECLSPQNELLMVTGTTGTFNKIGC